MIKSGSTIRQLKCVPIGSSPVKLEITVQRLECKDCGAVQQENIHFVRGKERYTYCMRRFVLDLCKIGTMVDVAKFVHMSCDTVKDILKTEFRHKFSRPDLSGLRNIGIDEFAVTKGHIYMTIVVDLETWLFVYVSEGKGANALDGLWPKLKRAGCRMKSVSSALSVAFIFAVNEHMPKAVQVYDHFHIIKLKNDKLEKVRRDTYNQEIDENKRCLIKSQRWLLLANGNNLSTSAETRRYKTLDINLPLATVYYLKESLHCV